MAHPHPIPAVEDAEYEFRLVVSYPVISRGAYRFVECKSPRMMHNVLKRVPHRSWFDTIVCIEATSLTREDKTPTILHTAIAGPVDIVLARLARKCKTELDTTQWHEMPTDYIGEQTVRLEEAQEWLHQARKMALEY